MDSNAVPLLIAVVWSFTGRYIDASKALRNENDCPALQLPHVMAEPSTPVPSGSAVTVHCQSPFRLVGNPTTTCNNGEFLDVPACENLDLFDISDMRVINDRRVNITLSSDGPWYSSWISGSKCLSDGRLVLCDTDNYKIKLLNRDFEVENTLSFRENSILVFNLAVINDTTIVITLPFRNQIQFISIAPTLSRRHTVSIGKKCFGIDVFNGTIYLSCYDGSIRLYDTAGNFKDTLGMRFGALYWISVSPVTGNLYVADWNARSVTGMTQAGAVLFTYTHPSLRRPQALLLDDLDNIVVADWKKDRITIIKNSDKSHRTLLTLNEGDGPYSLAYRREDKKLVVGLQWVQWFHVATLAK